MPNTFQVLGVLGAVFFVTPSFGNPIHSAAESPSAEEATASRTALPARRAPGLNICGGLLEGSRSSDECQILNPLFSFVKFENQGALGNIISKDCGVRPGEILQLVSVENGDRGPIGLWRNPKGGTCRLSDRRQDALLEKSRNAFLADLNDKNSLAKVSQNFFPSEDLYNQEFQLVSWALERGRLRSESLVSEISDFGRASQVPFSSTVKTFNLVKQNLDFEKLGSLAFEIEILGLHDLGKTKKTLKNLSAQAKNDFLKELTSLVEEHVRKNKGITPFDLENIARGLDLKVKKSESKSSILAATRFEVKGFRWIPRQEPISQK